jgi:hypothetical protein
MLDVIQVCCLQWLDEDMLISLYYVIHSVYSNPCTINGRFMFGKSDKVVIALSSCSDGTILSNKTLVSFVCYKYQSCWFLISILATIFSTFGHLISFMYSLGTLNSFSMISLLLP